MKVWIKNLAVEMEVKTSGIELAVYTADGLAQRGDLYVTKTGLVWCKGRTTKANGKKISWDQFISFAETKR